MRSIIQSITTRRSSRHTAETESSQEPSEHQSLPPSPSEQTSPQRSEHPPQQSETTTTIAGTTRTFSEAFPAEAAQADTMEVLNSRLSPNTRKNYRDHIIRFITWLFDHRKEFTGLLPPDFIDRLEEGAIRDQTSLTKTGLKKKRRTHLREVARQRLLHLNAKNPSTHPIILTNLTFDVVSYYFFSQNKNITKTIVDGKEVYMPSRGEGTEDTAEGEYVTIRVGPATYDGMTSGLTYLFQECKVAKDVNEKVREMWSELPRYKKGCHRKSAEEKRKLGIRNTGKDPLPLAAYIFLAELLCKSDDAEHIAAHLFLLLDWNLISRADMIVFSNIELIGMGNDCLRFEVGKSKTDQEGRKHIDHPFHIYSCPENPVICPVFALGKHLAHKPQILTGKCPLFEGSSQYNHYTNIFRRIVQSAEHRQSFIDSGMCPEYFGTHSMRKGKSKGCNISFNS